MVFTNEPATQSSLDRAAGRQPEMYRMFDGTSQLMSGRGPTCPRLCTLTLVGVSPAGSKPALLHRLRLGPQVCTEPAVTGSQDLARQHVSDGGHDADDNVDEAYSLFMTFMATFSS